METPIYLQIKKKIKEEIKVKNSNEAIESERVLASKYKASRMTVRRAIDELVEEGYLYRKKNKGTFVADESLWKKNPLEDDVDNIKHQLINFDIKFSVDEIIIEKLELSKTHIPSIIRGIRASFNNNKPIRIEEFYILRNHVEDLDISKFDKVLNLNSYLNEGNLRQQYKAVTVPLKYASTLKLAIDEPIIKTEGIVRNNVGKAFIYYVAYSHPDNDIIEITI